MQPLRWGRAQAASTDSGCKVPGAGERGVLHCAAQEFPCSDFTNLVLNASFLAPPPPCKHSHLRGRVYIYAQLVLPGMQEQSQHIYSSALGPREVTSWVQPPVTLLRAPSRWDTLPYWAVMLPSGMCPISQLCAFILLFPRSMRLCPSILKCPQVCL